MSTKPIDYRDELLTIYNLRVQRNSAYSLAAFARDLKLSLAALSMILNKKRGLSIINAERVIHLLGFSEAQKSAFLHSVQFYSSRAKPIKEQNYALDSIKNIPVNEIPFELKWQHLALREIVDLPDFSPSLVWIADKMKISEECALMLWQECLSAKLILTSLEGKFYASEHLVFGDRGPSETIKNLHRNFLQKAMDKIDTPITERSLSAVLLSVSEKQYEEITRLVSNFNTEMSRVIKTTDIENKDRVVCVGTQVFTL